MKLLHTRVKLVSLQGKGYIQGIKEGIRSSYKDTTVCPPSPLLHSVMFGPPLQAGVASSRSLEEVAELEQALCFLMKRSADIADAKAAKSHAMIHSATTSDTPRAVPGADDPSHPRGAHAEHAEADSLKSDSIPSRDHAEHAEGDGTNPESEGVSASSELITHEVEKLLPKAAHRVGTL